jgi:membrane-bound metal-dependent hydrolase YbcI (DUF457 family)
MRGSGHHATGFITGFIAASVSHKLCGVPLPLTVICIPFAWWGGVFPDSSEHFMGIRWVRHRTVTHWVPLWVVCLLAFMLFSSSSLLESAIQAAGIGFAMGGLTHLLFDWPNPRGIPFFTPWRHHSLKLWNSGRREIYLVLAWSLVASSFWIPELTWLLKT